MNVRPHSSVAVLLLFTITACSRSQPEAPAQTQAPPPAVDGSGAQVTGRLPAHMTGTSAVAVLEPIAASETPVNASPALMDQAGQQFLPGFLIAQSGQPVQFRNSEDVLHNVRVTELATEKTVFNIATVANASYEHRFERPGSYSVTCDIHPTMRADILVTSSPYAAIAGSDGAFTISGVPAGAYTLKLHAGGEPVVRSLDVKEGRVDLGVVQKAPL